MSDKQTQKMSLYFQFDFFLPMLDFGLSLALFLASLRPHNREKAMFSHANSLVCKVLRLAKPEF